MKKAKPIRVEQLTPDDWVNILRIARHMLKQKMFQKDQFKITIAAYEVFLDSRNYPEVPDSSKH